MEELKNKNVRLTKISLALFFFFGKMREKGGVKNENNHNDSRNNRNNCNLSSTHNLSTRTWTRLHRKEKKMAYRKTVKPKIDKKIFTNTAKKTKKINVNPKPSRGGIRL